MKHQNLGDRMKNDYENRYRIMLPRRVPIMLRLDGNAFHTFCKGMAKPFDNLFILYMNSTMEYLMSEISGAKIGYHQSDEISILLTDWENIDTEAYFDNNLQKLVSIAAGKASAWMTQTYNKRAVFDCRAFVLPTEEVENYFIWRQKDWQRNAIQMVARSIFSQKEVHGKNRDEMKTMLFSKEKDFDKETDCHKNGTFLFRNKITEFSVDKPKFEKYEKSIIENREEFQKILERYLK